jgi:hypothetical protein
MEIPAPDLDLLAEVKGSALSNHENADSLGKRSLSPPGKLPYTASYVAAVDMEMDVECASRHISPDSQSTPELALSLPRLALLYKPIRYMTSVYGATEIQHHWRALVRICRDQSIIPKDVITRESLENIPSYMVEYVPTGRDDRTEFRILDSSQTMARLLQVLGSHNALWESSVHEPLLSCAIESLAINFKISNAYVSAYCMLPVLNCLQFVIQGHVPIRSSVYWRALRHHRCEFFRSFRAQPRYPPRCCYL